tara:strand:+ start:3599 stop:3709 length:111 start_codon:yes stop_codon:yes gene_type:complete
MKLQDLTDLFWDVLESVHPYFWYAAWFGVGWLIGSW